jgi:hypothetical protein
LQVSRAADPETLQSQLAKTARKRLSLSGLELLHGRPCNAIAHVAGALGRPTFVALMHVPEWRWLLDRDDSPWYPATRLFRQSCAGDWPGVFARIADAVRARTAQAN